MLLIPDLKKVVILNPRTGSGSLYRAIMKRYPRTIMPYRHMEADGVPQGYDTWEKIGVVRNPVDRLWSLYNFLKVLHGGPWPEWGAAMRASVDRPFNDWVVNNDKVFNSGYYTGGGGAIEPFFAVRYPMPENRKSQRVILRPDMGTKIYRFGDQLGQLAADLDIEMGHINATVKAPIPNPSGDCFKHLCAHFAWDFAQIGVEEENFS